MSNYGYTVNNQNPTTITDNSNIYPQVFLVVDVTVKKGSGLDIPAYLVHLVYFFQSCLQYIAANKWTN